MNTQDINTGRAAVQYIFGAIGFAIGACSITLLGFWVAVLATVLAGLTLEYVESRVLSATSDASLAKIGASIGSVTGRISGLFTRKAAI